MCNTLPLAAPTRYVSFSISHLPLLQLSLYTSEHIVTMSSFLCSKNTSFIIKFNAILVRQYFFMQAHNLLDARLPLTSFCHFSFQGIKLNCSSGYCLNQIKNVSMITFRCERFLNTNYVSLNTGKIGLSYPILLSL